MSKTVYVEARKDEKPDAILCEHCESFFEGEKADQHIKNEPTHITTPLKLEIG